MHRFFVSCALLVVLCLIIVCVPQCVVESRDATPDDGHFDPHDHAQHTRVKDGMTADDARLAGHLAHYVLASILRFPDMSTARDKLEDIREGRNNFRTVADEMNRQFMVAGDTGQSSGDVGLITYKETVAPLARLLFDIRQPEADEKSMHLVGPVQTDEGVYVGAAFKRYRKQFFSRAWWELENFCTSTNMKTSDMLQLVENVERLWQISFMVWPDEHVTFKRLKIRQVRHDFGKIGSDDPASQMPEPKKKMDPVLHKARIDERIALFDRIKKHNPEIIEQYPEIYAMDPDEIRQRGWHPDDAAARRARERYASESHSSSANSDGSGATADSDEASA